MKKGLWLILIGALMLSMISMAQEKSSQKVVQFVIHTDYGDMKGYLYNETPEHRDNFIKLVKEGYYDGLLFHRVISNFMIQSGDPDSRNAQPGQRLGSGGPGYQVPAEFNKNFIHKKGALAAARQGDEVNPQKASSGSQFYIVQGKKYDEASLNVVTAKFVITFTDAQKKIYETEGGTPSLDMNYTVFGEITDGLDVIDKIAAVQKGPNDRPVQDIKMTIKLIP